MNKYLYATTPKCQHISSSPPISIVNNANTSIDQSVASVARVARVEYSNTICKSIALRGHAYCKWHIKEHAEDYKRFLVEQEQRNATHKRKYVFADADIRNAYIQKLSTGAKLYDLREDIALMTIMLEKLVNTKGVVDNKSVLHIIDLQRKCIATMNDIRKANIRAFTQDKLDTFMTRIAEIINTYAPDKRNEIGVKLLAVGKEYAEPGQAE